MDTVEEWVGNEQSCGRISDLTVSGSWSSCCSVTQLCSALCDPGDCNPPGSSVHGALQARIPEWVAISVSNHVTECPNFSISVD